MSPFRLWLALALVGCFVVAGAEAALARPAPAGRGDTPRAADGAVPGSIRLAQAQGTPPEDPAQAPVAPDATTPQDAQPEPIGNVATLSGTATVIRNKNSIAIKLKDDIYLNDTVQTSAGAALSITFNDDTTFRLSANAKITIDTYIYDPNGKQNAGAFDIAKGTVAFVAAAVAKTGDMKITTPTATLGIRGTTGLVEVPEGATAANANNVAIKLYPDADGRVGHIEVNDRQGVRLGSLTQGASGFTIRPGAGGGARFAAVPLTISPRDVARDRGFVTQLHAAQTTGRQIVTEQRAFRRANPNFNRNNPAGRQPGANTPNRGNQPGQPGANPNRGNQPGQQRPGGQPGQNRPGQQPNGAPNRPGQQQPGAPNNRQGQTPGQPGAAGQRSGQNPPAAQPGAPGQPPRPGERPLPNQPGQPGQPQHSGQGPEQGRRPGTPATPTLPPRQGALPGGVPGASRPGFQRPGLQRPGFTGRPALRQPPPKGKREKER
jgi:hypothetical protein